MPEILNISVDLIEEPELPRPHYPEKINELTSSILNIGIIQPLIVGRTGEHYKLICGEGRLMAAKRASFPTVPCIVIPADHEQALAMSLHENLFRQDLSPVDESKLYLYMRDQLKYSSKKIATMVSKSDAYVCQHLDLLTWLPEIVDALRDLKISFSVARELSYCTDKRHTLWLLKSAIEGGATQRTVRSWIVTWRMSKVPEKSYDDEGLPFVTLPDYEPPKLKCGLCGKPHTSVELQTLLICQTCIREMDKASKS